MSQCRYCMLFQTIHESLRRWDRSDENKRKSERYCSLKGEHVMNDSPECEHFILAQNFWCKKDNQWVSVSSCINRRRKKLCKIKCLQGKIIVSKMRGIRIEPKIEPPKEEKLTLNLRKKEPQKPTLNLRQR